MMIRECCVLLHYLYKHELKRDCLWTFESDLAKCCILLFLLYKAYSSAFDDLFFVIIVLESFLTCAGNCESLILFIVLFCKSLCTQSFHFYGL